MALEVGIKGIVHRKNNIFNLSTHHYDDGGVGEVSRRLQHSNLHRLDTLLTPQEQYRGMLCFYFKYCLSYNQCSSDHEAG